MFTPFFAAKTCKTIVALLSIMAAFSSNIIESKFPEAEPARWPHKPVYVQPGNDMKVAGLSSNQPIPLGIPIDIESPLFKGRVLLRFRNAKSDNPSAHESYFNGRKRLMQTVVQGQFKRPMKMSEVYVGSIFSQPLAGAPPPLMSKIMDMVIRRVAPGVLLDLSSATPKVIALLAGTAQTMSIDKPGNEPEITVPVIEENVASVLGAKCSTKSKRKKHLGNPKKAEAYVYDTESVYTFHTYDDAMDYGRGTMHIPMYGEFDIKPHIGRQPLSLTAVTLDGDILYDLRVWHESNYR